MVCDIQVGTAVILAGGKSSRMGFDKQNLRLNGKPFIEQQLHTLSKLFQEIIVVTNKAGLYLDYNCKTTADTLQDFGPMGGVHAGLSFASGRYCYIIACDMPIINEDYISYLFNRLNKSTLPPEAVITRFGDWVEPFNAIYSKDILPAIEQAYQIGDRKIGNMLKQVRTEYISEEEARRFSPDWSMFANINTIEECKSYSNVCSITKEEFLWRKEY